MSVADSTQAYLVIKQIDLAKLIESQIDLLTTDHLTRLFGIQSQNAGRLADALRERGALPADTARLLETLDQAVDELARLMRAAGRDGTG